MVPLTSCCGGPVCSVATNATASAALRCPLSYLSKVTTPDFFYKLRAKLLILAATSLLGHTARAL